MDPGADKKPDAAGGEITALLVQWSAERPEPAPLLIKLVYQDLRSMAAAYMRREREDHTLQATALVHEAYLRMFQGAPFRWQDRDQFYCAVARTMRRILVDYARSRRAAKRWGGKEKVPLEDITLLAEARPAHLVALDGALAELAELNPRQAEVVELLWFVGLTQNEAAAILKVSQKTVQNDWSFARAWLQRRLSAPEVLN